MAAGRSRIGWKSGLTSRVMRQALGITSPDSGVLLDNMLFDGGDHVAKGRFIQPHIEAEITFVMGADISDTRITRTNPQTGKARIITDTVSDNAPTQGL